MAQSFRKTEILEIAHHDGRVVVEDLAERFGVTTQTIRRDLSDLANEGKLNRVHGGAIMPAGAANIRYSVRRAINEDAKDAIAALCAREIPNNSSVLLSIGTSTEAVANALLGHENLTILTNNLNVATIMSANLSCQIIITGGVLRPHDGGLVGDLTAQAIERFKVEHAVIGTSALDLEGDLMDFDLQEVRVSRTIINLSKKTFLVTDSSKLERSAPVKVASLSEIDAIFSNRLPVELKQQCHEWGTAVFETECAKGYVQRQ